MIRKTVSAAVLFLVMALFSAACSPEHTPDEVRQLKVTQGTDQYALPGEPFSKELRIIACGPEERSAGGKIRSRGIPGIRLLLTPVEGSDLKIEPSEVVPEPGGSGTEPEAVNEEISCRVMENEQEINMLTKRYEQSHIERRNAGKCAVEASVIFIEMLWELERIGDHLANIAVRAPEIQKHYFALR